MRYLFQFELAKLDFAQEFSHCRIWNYSIKMISKYGVLKQQVISTRLCEVCKRNHLLDFSFLWIDDIQFICLAYRITLRTEKFEPSQTATINAIFVCIETLYGSRIRHIFMIETDIGFSNWKKNFVTMNEHWLWHTVESRICSVCVCVHV